MRVTETRMMAQASRAVSDARGRAARAGEVLSSGVAVERPSQDLAAWATGIRASARVQSEQGQRDGLARARDGLSEVDTVLDSVGSAVSRARELAIQLGNGTYTAEARANAATEVRSLLSGAISSANWRSFGNEFALAGTDGDVAAFAADGTYQGNGAERLVGDPSGGGVAANVPGTMLGAGFGVDVFATLESLAVALETNDTAGVTALLDPLQTAVSQVASARTAVGSRLGALDNAISMSETFELQATKAFDASVQADPVRAASEFSSLSFQLEQSRMAAEQIIRTARGR